MSESRISMTLEEFEFSERTYRCLKNAGILTSRDLERKTYSDMMKVRNLDQKSLEEIIIKLHALGLDLNEELSTNVDKEYDSPNHKLQIALTKNYVENLGLLKKEQVTSSIYYQWVGIINGIYDLVQAMNNLLLSTEQKLENITKTKEYAELFNLLKTLFSIIGEVNGCLLFEDSQFGKLLIAYANIKTDKLSSLDSFRLKVEQYLARRIYSQNSMTKEMIDDLRFDREISRKMRAKFRKKHKQQFVLETENKLPQIRPSKSDVLYIYKGNILCHKSKHNLIQATAVIYTKDDNETHLNIEYCTECKKFLLEYNLFEEYRQQHSILIGNFKILTEEKFHGDFELAKESPLMLSGYTVNQKDGLLSRDRHYLLARLIYDGIMKKGEIIRYLTYFIHKNGAKKGNEIALSKWQEDLKFVQNYNINIQPRTVITDIQPY